ncbi:MAG TPA: UTP--glucose-1-phosphate uridylyltransferase GalU [Thermodesulfobacteriota bacterium]|nr:UTP--glucose-1-phosphate uridylyltransferase GalU [Thermodesulfobacteriota bacterium]
MKDRIRKAVFPAAGLGTRFLPATKASPKEMLPLVDKPLIQYGVEEAIASGIEQVIIVTGRGKTAIEDHFDTSKELELLLEEKGNRRLLREVQEISNMVDFAYVRQKEPLGLGHAVLCARNLVGDEPFAIFLGDDIIDARVPAMRQLIEVYRRYQASVVAVVRVPRAQISAYGVIVPERIADRVYQVRDLVEKPPVERAPSELAVIGRYVLTPRIFAKLAETKPGKGGEIQLTDAIRALLADEPVYALEIEGERYDAGDKLGFLKANVCFALKRPELREEFRKFLRGLDVR